MSESPAVDDKLHFDLPIWMIGEGVRRGKVPHNVMRLKTSAGIVLPMFTEEGNCDGFIAHTGRSGKTAWKVETANLLIEVVENSGVANVAFDIQPGGAAMQYPAHMVTGWVRRRWLSN